jgi:hypothetical protein
MRPWVSLYRWSEDLPRRGYSTQPRVSTVGTLTEHREAVLVSPRGHGAISRFDFLLSLSPSGIAAGPNPEEPGY